MREKQRVKLIALALCAAVLLSACGTGAGDDSGSSTGNYTESPETEYQGKLDVIRPIAYSKVDGIELEPGTYLSIIGREADSEYWNEVKAGAEQAVADLNAALGYTGADQIKLTYNGPSKADDVDEQVNILDEELARYPAALGIAIVDTKACEVQFDLAAENSIPIVAFDSGNDYQGLISMCSTNNGEAAKTAACKLAGLIEDKGEVAVFIHDAHSTSATEREEGFISELTNNYPEVSVVNIYHLDELEKMAPEVAEYLNGKRGEGEEEILPEAITEMDVVAYIFEKNPQIKGCFGSNYDATRLIVKALDEMEQDDIQVVGFDGGEAQIKDLGDKIDGLIVQNPFGMGYATVIAAARASVDMPNEAFVDTGYTWVTDDNVKKANIKKMLY